MLRILINNTFLNDICGRILGGESRFLKAVLILLLVAAGLFMGGIWHFLEYLNFRPYSLFKHMLQARIKTT